MLGKFLGHVIVPASQYWLARFDSRIVIIQNNACQERGALKRKIKKEEESKEKRKKHASFKDNYESTSAYERFQIQCITENLFDYCCSWGFDGLSLVNSLATQTQAQEESSVT